MMFCLLRALGQTQFEPAFLPNAELVSTHTPQTWSGDLLVLAVTEEDFHTTEGVVSIKSETLKAFDTDFGSAVSAIINEGGFEGKKGVPSKVVRVGTAPSAKAQYLAMVGLGKQEKISTASEWGPSCYQSLGTSVATLAKSNKSKTVGVAFLTQPPADSTSIISKQVVTGALLGGYETTRFKSKPSPTASKLQTLHLLLPTAPASAASTSTADEAVKTAIAVSKGALLTRYLVEAPPNVCTPTHLAEAAQHLTSTFPSVLSLKVLEKVECEALGMGSYLGVAEASEHPPKFIHLTYKPQQQQQQGSSDDHKVVALVGKGLTFDSGGYNIKAGPGSMIEMMKFDMGGAAATLGAARIIAELEPQGVEVHFIVAACENMIAGKGLRPGDVLTAANGKTIEVNNTDAEGRLTLADALWYAQEKCGAKSIVDSATLTGACIVALGTDVAGLFTPSNTMAEQIKSAAQNTGEKFWRMPMEAGYFDQMKSPIADMKNAGGRFGGSITAALFLEQFIKEGVEWAHLDIAGPVWDEKANLPTGFGASTLAEWAMSQGLKKL
ncbi:hypothetical protein CEUSTIGMA_g13323.t1 [Chlamydomonas eustigma]|uniref:Cytosol aminopeptidase domain-containing protein n=1 Tax=Chlamydomonas eustigma TaxID=1157962 RepID=A0A250XS42_9CHLO|nr:hypothetical protein CEUSTIGMA_g13323.t1 [Chlamydomonas eustigma]|eukprot:GAX85907.1 hypothetical protein CEUSTIGMA_g13323.t1 [Chlamydomonas eustigma]